MAASLIVYWDDYDIAHALARLHRRTGCSPTTTRCTGARSTAPRSWCDPRRAGQRHRAPSCTRARESWSAGLGLLPHPRRRAPARLHRVSADACRRASTCDAVVRGEIADPHADLPAQSRLSRPRRRAGLPAARSREPGLRRGHRVAECRSRVGGRSGLPRPSGSSRSGRRRPSPVRRAGSRNSGMNGQAGHGLTRPVLRSHSIRAVRLRPCSSGGVRSHGSSVTAAVTRRRSRTPRAST